MISDQPTLKRPDIRFGLPLLLVIGLILRLTFIGDEGFKTDVQTFQSWTISLLDHGLGAFYSSTSFVDYPPGYFYVLALLGHIWAPFRSHDQSLFILKLLVKVPAIIADLGIGVLIYRLVKKYAKVGIALLAASLYLLNPAVIFISAKWGQVDSVAAFFAVLAIYLLHRAYGTSGRDVQLIVLAWLSFAFSLLIKPQAAVLLPLLIAFAFADIGARKTRILATVMGISASVLLALAICLPFHADANPIAVFGWLFHRYTASAATYPFNSVNAFNLWAIRYPFWSPDDTRVLFFPQFVWGLLLLCVALGLIVARYLQKAKNEDFLQSCVLSLFAFFVLSTRMHERYSFDALVFMIPAIAFARRYLFGVIIVSALLLLNLIYAQQYLDVMMAHNALGVDVRHLCGSWTSLFSFCMVATFFYLGYIYLGTTETENAAIEPTGEFPALSRFWAQVSGGANSWFNPREGMAALRWPLDYAIMAAFGVGTFVMSFVGYWYPKGKIFDEVYFSRAAEEYLNNQRIYENTHPPLSKLLITVSVMLFGGMPKGHGLGGWTGLNAIIGHMANGDNSYGWRFLDVLFGAMAVMILFALAKRITRSTLFASVAAVLFAFDGMRFVQSRIATPEGLVIVFSLLAVYALYRFLIASQTAERRSVTINSTVFTVATAGSIVGGLVLGLVAHAVWDLTTPACIVLVVYFTMGLYLFARYVAIPKFFADGKRERSYPEGSVALVGPSTVVLNTIDGGEIDSRTKSPRRGEIARSADGGLLTASNSLTVEYGRDARVTYRSPDGEAVYDGQTADTGNHVEHSQPRRFWFIVFATALGLFVGSKWYGVMGFGVSFTALIAIAAQRWFFSRRPMLWGNPRGFRLDGALVAIAFIAATVYGLIWLPDILRHSPDRNEVHNLNEVVARQYGMFEYHSNLRATHPYSSKWWEWPLDVVPVVYYYKDNRKNQTDPQGCCVEEITSMPNPFILWFGLLCVPIVGFLAYRERNKGYALIVLTYLYQWLPWMRSPRLAWEYHFYVDVPLICLCNAIVLQHLWKWASPKGHGVFAGLFVAGYVFLVIGSFMFFYPILSAHPLVWEQWHARMWFEKWVVGPG